MSNAKPFKWIKKSLATVSALMLLSPIAFSPAAMAQASNDTAIVCTHPGASVDQARKTLIDKGCTILAETPCKAGKFTIFKVRPSNGNVSGIVAEFQGKVDPNIKSAEPAFKTKAQWGCWPRPTCTPNDPYYSVQYALQAMNWNDARCTMKLLGVNQRAVPRVTLIDVGCDSIADEMDNVTQYNFVGGQPGVLEPAMGTGTNHGTGVASVMAAKTHNSKFLAGVASHNVAVKVTSCRISNDGLNIDIFDVVNAMTWCVDHQAERGGPGAINVSLNSSTVNTFNASPVLQEIAGAAKANGDLFVNGSGNSGLEDVSPEQNIRRVGGLDETNMRWVSSNYGPFKAYVPCVNIALMSSQTAVGYRSGTSLACPQWAAIIALLQSISPRLTVSKADAIVYGTADRTPEGLRIPNVNTAVIYTILFGWF